MPDDQPALINRSHHTTACAADCGSRCYLAYSLADTDDGCPKHCSIEIEELNNGEGILVYLAKRAQDLLQRPGLRFLYMGTRRPTPELLFNDTCQGATGKNWLHGYGGSIRIYKGLLLRSGHQSRVEVCNLDGESLAYGPFYTHQEYLDNGGATWVQKLAEDLADQYLQGKGASS